MKKIDLIQKSLVDMVLRIIKRVIFILGISLFVHSQSHCQDIKKVQFSACITETFERIEHIRSYYTPIYIETSIDTILGNILLDETTNTFKIEWIDGRSWVYSYSNFKEYNRKWPKGIECGRKQTIRTYYGKKIDGCEASIMIISWDIPGSCQFKISECEKLYSGIKIWKYNYEFETVEACLY
jgi:hypothetical protein